MAVLLEQLNSWIWGPWLIILFMGTGIFLTVRLRFLPWKNLGFALRQVVRDIFCPNDSKNGEISPFQSLMTAMAAMMGTGNIAGVATAMVLGGPGALVWMVLAALVSLSVSLTENALTMKYRIRSREGKILGGPMYVMEKAIKPVFFGRTLATMFSLFTLGASLGMGNMTQANCISEAFSDTLDIPSALTGLILFFLSFLVLMGGISCIGRVCGILVPVMSVLFLAATIAVIVINRENVYDGVKEMFIMAFSFEAVAGGLGGTIVAGMTKSMRYGISRGVFSNEAGLGSAPIAGAAAKTDDPVKQSYILMTGTFFDTIVVCLATGIAIASSGLLGAVDLNGELITGVALTNLVFETALGPAGRIIVTAGIAMFAFATIIGWEYYGEKALEYIIREKSGRLNNNRGRMLAFYRIIYCTCVFAGATASLRTVWNFSDIMNACMAVPNLVCMIILNREAAQFLQGYEKNKN